MNHLFQKIFILISILFLSFSLISETNAIKVTVSQNLSAIGLPCTSKSTSEEGQSKTPVYECEIGTGFSSVTGIFQGLLKFVAFIAGLGAVLFIVVNGILYSMAGMDEHLKSDVKHKIFMMLGGIVLLLLSGVVLQVIAPWVYR